MAEIRHIVGTQIPADGEYLLLARGLERDTYEVSAQLQNRPTSFRRKTVHGSPHEARKVAQQIATNLEVPVIYEVAS
jgi:hypothetical protein